MLDLLKPERPNWRHYFGSLALLMLILQFATGVFLSLFYEPTLAGAYKSVQVLTNEIPAGSLSRNLHRWIAFAFFMAVFVHTARCTLRKDFMNPNKRVDWLTGVLLVWPVFLLLYTGLILPWEWKGYWFMEMVPSYAGSIPLIGPDLKAFFLMEFTLPRYLTVHMLLLPAVCLVLVDYHLMTKLRKRGIFRHLLRHLVIALPFIALLVALSVYMTIPSSDPNEIPLPLEGAYIPEPEWWGLLILLPFMYFRGPLVPTLAVYIPLAIFIIIAFMPYYLRDRKAEKPVETQEVPMRPEGRTRVVANIIRGVMVFVITAVFFGLVYYGNYMSPTLGCNSCHNLSRGIRMGVPPETFRDRRTLPNLDDDKWMMGHWYYPNEIY